MPNMTLSIPEKLYKKMKKHPEIKWSELVRQSIEAAINDKELLDDLKDFLEAEENYKKGKIITHEKLLKILRAKK